MNDRHCHPGNTAPVHHVLGDAIDLGDGRRDLGLGNGRGRVRIRSEVTDVFVAALSSGGRAVPGDPDVEPVLLEVDPVQAVTTKAIVAPMAVPVSLDRLFVMITSRLCQMTAGRGR